MDRAKGRPFLKGRTLKLQEEPSGVPSRRRVFRVSREAAADLGRRGLPAKAWDWRLIDMVRARVLVGRDRGLFRVRVRVLRKRKRSVRLSCCHWWR